MKFFVLILLLNLTDGSEENIVSVTGYQGGSINITCQYPEMYDNHTKILCKLLGSHCVEVNFTLSSFPQSEIKKFTKSYKQKSRMLSVLVTFLDDEDTAVYWCGVKESGITIDRVSAVVLHVTPVIGHEGGEVHIKCPYDHGSEVFPKSFYKNTLEQPHTTLQRPFSLVDDTDARVFTVTVGGLTANDSGGYDCVIEKTSAVYRGHLVLVTELITVSSYEGGTASVSCPYLDKSIKQHEKYFCRGEKPAVCLNFNTKVSTSQPVRARYALKDEPALGVFTLTITNLKAEDAGIYWCGEHYGQYFTSKIIVEVNNVLPVVIGKEGSSVSIPCKYGRVQDRDHSKIFCRGETSDVCMLNTTLISLTNTTQGRFTLKDDPASRVFTVTIAFLREEDSGTFWCVEVGQRVRFNSAVILKITKDSQMILYVSVTLVTVLVLVLGTAFFMVVFKRRRNQLQGVPAVSAHYRTSLHDRENSDDALYQNCRMDQGPVDLNSTKQK